MDGIFRLRFEHVAEDGATTRSEHFFPATTFLASANADGLLTEKAKALRDKVIGSLKEDGIIPAPDNVIRVDFQRRKRA